LKSIVTGCSAAAASSDHNHPDWRRAATSPSHHTRRLSRQQKKKRYEADKPGGSPNIHDSFGHRLVRLLVKAESSSLRSPWSDPIAQDLATNLYR
jgi:hypothetical protein